MIEYLIGIGAIEAGVFLWKNLQTPEAVTALDNVVGLVL